MAAPERDLFGARQSEYEVPANANRVACASCGAAMIWIRTAHGRAMPLSVATIETRDGQQFALPHFADCPSADEWRSTRK
jgi:hypothetical protein